MGAARKLQVADLFCGAGGTSTGVALACRELDVAVELLAINHWQTAIATHTKNHPWARHMCANVEAVDPRQVVPGGKLDLLVASPECIWHSTARGGKPINDQKRASAWRVLEWCEKLHVRNVLIENVPEFRGWGPLGEDNRPLKSKKGSIFYAFVQALEAMNYRVEYRVLNAADYGAATSRRRLFILGRKGTRAIRWPSQTHSRDALKDGGIFRDLKPWRAAREIIDWGIEGQSIFTRKKPLAHTTLMRIRAGLIRYGGPLAPLFVSALDAYMGGKAQGAPVEISLSNGTAEAFMAILNNNNVAKPVSQPVPTIVAGGGHVALVDPQAFVVEMEHSKNGAAHIRPVSNPLPTVTTAKGGSMGVCEPEAFMLPGRQFELNGADPIDKPLRTVMPTHTPSLVEPKTFILPQNTTNRPRGTDEPIPTLTTTSRGVAIVDPKAFIVPFYGERPGQDGRTHDVDAPLPTAPASPKFGVTQPFIVGAGGPTGQGGPQGVDEPLATLLARNHRVIVEPIIVTPGGANLPNGKPVSEPLPTVMGSDRFALAVPVIVQPAHGGGDARRTTSIDSPLPTQPCSNRFALASPVVVQVNHGGGDSGRTQSVEEPLKAATTHNGHALVEPSIAKFYGEPEKNVASVSEPCPTVTCKDRFGLVEPVVTQIGIDIRFRMFKTHELARAMGFEKYQFTGNTEEVTRQIGNAVEVNIAKALVKPLLDS
jgi:DNA (cytosine-5)-methyltransferase 1